MIGGEKVVRARYTADGRVAVAVERFGLVYWSADLGRTWQRSSDDALAHGQGTGSTHGAAMVAA